MKRTARTFSLLAAIAFGFSTWMITWLQFPIAAGAAFLPGVLLVIDRLLQGVGGVLEQESARNGFGRFFLWAFARLGDHWACEIRKHQAP